jgi:hypothetical protein
VGRRRCEEQVVPVLNHAAQGHEGLPGVLLLTPLSRARGPAEPRAARSRDEALDMPSLLGDGSCPPPPRGLYDSLGTTCVDVPLVLYLYEPRLPL